MTNPNLTPEGAERCGFGSRVRESSNLGRGLNNHFSSYPQNRDCQEYILGISSFPFSMASLRVQVHDVFLSYHDSTRLQSAKAQERHLSNYLGLCLNPRIFNL